MTPCRSLETTIFASRRSLAHIWHWRCPRNIELKTRMNEPSIFGVTILRLNEQMKLRNLYSI